MSVMPRKHSYQHPGRPRRGVSGGAALVCRRLIVLTMVASFLCYNGGKARFGLRRRVIRMLYRKLVRPVLFVLSRKDPEVAHEKALALLEWFERHEGLLNLLRSFSVKNIYLRRKVFE